MRGRRVAGFLLSLALLGALTSCGKGTIGRYKGMIESYGNEVDVSKLVFLKDELQSLSDEFIKNDYTITIEAFERNDLTEYFKYNKLDTTEKGFIEINRNQKIKYDKDTNNYCVTENTKSISEGNTVDEAANATSSTETEIYYEDRTDKALLFNNKRMSMEHLPVGVWQRIKESMSPNSMLHTLGVLKYIDELPKTYFIDDNKYTTLVDYNDKQNDYYGEIQLIISNNEIKTAYHFKHSYIDDGDKLYSKRDEELGGVITIAKKKNNIKSRNQDKYVNINDRVYLG